MGKRLVLFTVAEIEVAGPKEVGGFSWADAAVMVLLWDWKRGIMVPTRTFVREIPCL